MLRNIFLSETGVSPPHDLLWSSKPHLQSSPVTCKRHCYTALSDKLQCMGGLYSFLSYLNLVGLMSIISVG
ncbi:hypothetical protein BDV12DRAFT_170389 [Aspergillus spectabilis]